MRNSIINCRYKFKILLVPPDFETFPSIPYIVHQMFDLSDPQWPGYLIYTIQMAIH